MIGSNRAWAANTVFLLDGNWGHVAISGVEFVVITVISPDCKRLQKVGGVRLLK